MKIAKLGLWMALVGGGGEILAAKIARRSVATLARFGAVPT